MNVALFSLYASIPIDFAARFCFWRFFNLEASFLVINADDYYGEESYRIAAYFVINQCLNKVFGCVCFPVRNTLMNNRNVNRGVCIVKDENVTQIVESSLKVVNNKIIMASPLDGSEKFTISFETLVSMNMFIFSPEVFSIL